MEMVLTKDRRSTRLGIVFAMLMLLLGSVMPGGMALAAPGNWVQMGADNALGAPPTGNPTELFVFGGELYAYNDYGLFHMRLSPSLKWEKLPTPCAPGNWSFRPMGNTLYLYSKKLYRILQGQAFTPANWAEVHSFGTPGGADPVPLVLFNGQVYGVYYPAGSSTFEIWRSPDHGKTAMTWTKVVASGFGDPQNHALGFITVFKGKLIAATTMTRTSGFGDPSGFGQGVEIWESPTGNLGSWTQVNVDGFGTQTTVVGSNKTFRTNQDVGGYAVYNGYLYVGTKSHYGAEVWRYNGLGKSGWTNVTPPWAGVSMLMSSPGRNMAMAVYGNELYLAEGFPTGNLAKYNGKNWTIVVSGPNPFDPDNGGIGSLAVLGGKLYAATIHKPYAGKAVKGDQVWGYPYIIPRLPDLLYDPPLIRYLVPANLIEIFPVIKNQGGSPIQDEYSIAFYLDREELLYEAPGPMLEPGESRELAFEFNVPEGEHTLTIVLDPEGRIREGNEDNNIAVVSFSVPGEAGSGREGTGWNVEAVPVCGSSEESHLLHVTWNTGVEGAQSVFLEIGYPDGRTDEVELPGPSGEIDVSVGLPEGGILLLTLRVVTPTGERTSSMSIELPPC